ncbi:hypothetical protein [Salinimicrobium xinjiangense]|uniref:hypothetical protein n=1 Tax=Salinimicrobium xinjiangense TaxID=438596 RepID=UPI0003FA28E2|nr:hypothetical protein [Salinimicrobium xinjiangense]
MKKQLLILCLLINTTILTAQSNETFELKAKYEAPETKEDFQMELFQGIQKIQFSLDNNPALNGKDYRIVIKEYQDGELHSEKIVLDTKEERLPKIDSTFKFTLFAQNLLNYQKIAFFFPRFMNKKIYQTKDTFKDGDFSLRQINVGSEHLNFQFNEPFQVALITPPNRDPSKGNLGYCEVSQGGIEIAKWYEKYQIPQFFLVYLEIG